MFIQKLKSFIAPLHYSQPRFWWNFFASGPIYFDNFLFWCYPNDSLKTLFLSTSVFLSICLSVCFLLPLFFLHHIIMELSLGVMSMPLLPLLPKDPQTHIHHPWGHRPHGKQKIGHGVNQPRDVETRTPYSSADGA